jgi:hypothetical protein
MVSFIFIVLLLLCLDVSTVLFKFKVQKKSGHQSLESCPATRHAGVKGPYSFLTSALDGGECTASCPGRTLPPRKVPQYTLDRTLTARGTDGNYKQHVQITCHDTKTSPGPLTWERRVINYHTKEPKGRQRKTHVLSSRNRSTCVGYL